MHDIKTLEEAFKKAQQMESDVDVSIPMEKGQLEEKTEMLHKTIRKLSLQNPTYGVLIVGRKDTQRTHVDTKDSELYKIIISMRSIEISPNT